MKWDFGSHLNFFFFLKKDTINNAVENAKLEIILFHKILHFKETFSWFWMIFNLDLCIDKCFDGSFNTKTNLFTPGSGFI